MNSLNIHDKTFVPYFPPEAIEKKVTQLGRQISKDFSGRCPLFLAVLNGAFIFASDLFRHISIEAEITFIKLASYQGTTSTGTVATHIGLEKAVTGRHIIIVEDIIDTGKTLHEFIPTVLQQQPASLKIVSLLIKPDAMKFPVEVDYFGFEIPEKFVVGYGLDFNGLGRNIPGIYQLADEAF